MSDDLLKRHASIKKSSDGTVATPQTRSTASSRPQHSQVLTQRLLSLKHFVKGFTSYFEAIAELQASNSKSYAKLGEHLSIPVPENAPYMAGNKYNALQNLLASVKEDNLEIANSYSHLAKNLETAVVEPLRAIRLEIKAQSRAIENEVGKLEEIGEKFAVASSNALVTFNHALSTHKAGNVDLTAKSEPYVASRNLKAVLLSSLHHENELNSVTIAWQQRCKTLEETVIKQLQTIWNTFNEWRQSALVEQDKKWAGIMRNISGLKPETEWSQLEANGVLLNPRVHPRKPGSITFPGQSEAMPIREAVLERKRRFAAIYKRDHFVLTPAGFLHEFDLKDDSPDPELSLYLRNCMLGPTSEPNSKTHKFWIGGNRAHRGSLDKGLKSLKIGASEIQYVFRFSTHAEMMDWWHDCSKFCKASYTTLAHAKDASSYPANALEDKAAIERKSGETTEEEGYLSADDDVPAYKSPTTKVQFDTAEKTRTKVPADQTRKEPGSPAPTSVPEVTRTVSTSTKKLIAAEEGFGSGIGDTASIRGEKNSDSRFQEHIK